MEGEGAVVDDSGTVCIDWPTTLADAPLEWNALLTTANSPLGSRYEYPSPQQIADAWNTEERREELRYFVNNREHGIKTHQDAKIKAKLTELGLLP